LTVDEIQRLSFRARHSPFSIKQTARDRWMRLMNSAFGEAALPEKAEQVLRKVVRNKTDS
jgi:truncated hemoglobin YjbI